MRRGNVRWDVDAYGGSLLRDQLRAELADARAAGTALTTQSTDALHHAVHASFLEAHPLGPPQPREPESAWCTANLPEDVYWRSMAVHEAAHAVLALKLGLTVQQLTLASERTSALGGGAVVKGPGDAQHFAVELLGAGHAQAIWLEAYDYSHPELKRCVLKLGASGDQTVVDGHIGDGFVIDRNRAVADALRVLAMPGTMDAIEGVAVVLESQRELSDKDVTFLADQYHVDELPDGAVWSPSAQDLANAQPQDVRPTADQQPGAEPTRSRLRDILDRLEAGRVQRARLVGRASERPVRQPQHNSQQPQAQSLEYPQAPDGRGRA